MKKLRNKQGGFTLIEVVLVLAIGALIILLALLAFTGAQRARRDTARTDLVGNIKAAVEQYAANHDGDFPDNGTFLTMVTANGWKDPAGGTSTITSGSGTLTSPGIKYNQGFTCAGAAAASATTTTYRIDYNQESGGTTVCKDSTK